MVLEFEIIRIVITIVVVILLGIIFGKICAKFHISELIGFIVAGLVLSPHSLGGFLVIFDEPLIVMNDWTVIFGIVAGIIILFSAGLHFTFKDLKKAGLKSGTIGFLGLAAPLIIAYYVSISLGLDWISSFLIGLTLSATSIAVSVTALKELGTQNTEEGNVLVQAAVIDDVLALSVLAAVSSIVVSQTIPDLSTIAFEGIQKIGFWIIMLLVSAFILPKIVHFISEKNHSDNIMGVFAMGSAFGFAGFASALSLNPVVGAFAAGMGLASAKVVVQIRHLTENLRFIFAPFFFGLMGLHVDITTIVEINWIYFGVLIIVAVFSKVLGCGISAGLFLKSKRKGMVVGFGMVPRGEIAFIIAGTGLAMNAFSSEVFSTLIFVVLFTILITPVLLKHASSSVKK
jgi:Kef-type K+ transport system membrane component KefB